MIDRATDPDADHAAADVVTPEMRAVVAFMDSLPPEILIELLRRAPDGNDLDLAAWAYCFNPAAAVLGPAHWTALRYVINKRGIPGLEALAAVRGAWTRLVEVQGRAIILARINASVCERTRGLLQRPDLLWRVNSAVRRLLHETGALTAIGSPDFNHGVRQCLRIVGTHDQFCGIWRDVFGAFMAMDEFQPVRVQAFDFVSALLDHRLKTGSFRMPRTPAQSRAS